MRILVISDTHGNDSAIFKAHEQSGPVDILIHAGDGEQDAFLFGEVTGCTVIRVAGNCDLGSRAPRELIVTLAGKIIMITHGDRYYVKSGLENLRKQARNQKAQIIIYGHTHLALNEFLDSQLLLNPGTLCCQAGFHSYAILEISQDGIEAEIHELC